MLLAREFSESGEGAAVVSARSDFAPFFSVDPDVGGFVEVIGYDGFYAVQQRGLIERSRQVAQPARYERVGPAASATFFPVDLESGLSLDLRCHTPFLTTWHVDPETGLYSSVGTRAARVVARWTPDRPETWTDQTVLFANTYGDSPAVPLSSTSEVVFPVGYAREYSFLAGATPTGFLKTKTAFAGGLGAGNAWGAESGAEVLGTSGGSSISAWQGLFIDNTDAAAALICSLTFRTPAGR